MQNTTAEDTGAPCDGASSRSRRSLVRTELFNVPREILALFAFFGSSQGGLKLSIAPYLRTQPSLDV
jgi:hypothetical protein